MKRKAVMTVLCWIAAAWVATAPAVSQEGGLHVADAKLGKGVADREIQEETPAFAVGEKAFLWLKVTGGPGEIQVHWKLDDATDTVRLDVGGDPWRTWANKTLHQAGSWMVTVTGPDGSTLTELPFVVH